MLRSGGAVPDGRPPASPPRRRRGRSAGGPARQGLRQNALLEDLQPSEYTSSSTRSRAAACSHSLRIQARPGRIMTTARTCAAPPRTEARTSSACSCMRKTVAGRESVGIVNVERTGMHRLPLIQSYSAVVLTSQLWQFSYASLLFALMSQVRLSNAFTMMIYCPWTNSTLSGPSLLGFPLWGN